MDNMERIKRTSRKLRLASALLFWAVPLACATYWACFNSLPELMKPAYLADWRPVLPELNRALCFVVALFPAGVAMRGFATMRRLFGLYEAGELFSARNVACYRGLGRTLLAWAGAVFLATPLLSLAASVGMPPGQRRLSLVLESLELVALFAGAAAVVISWVMDEGRSIEEDRALTI